MRSLSVLSVACLGILAAFPAPAAVHVVRPDGMGDFPTVQDAIDASMDGDVIALTTGIFTGDGNRDIDCEGKAIAVRSISRDPDRCIIECEGTEEEPHRGFTRFWCGTGELVLEGVTIRGGHSSQGGGGATIGSGAKIRNCVFIDNSSEFWGGAITGGGSDVEISDCKFIDNLAQYYGGAIYVGFTGEIRDCLFLRNSGLAGGAINVATWPGETESLVIERCRMVENVAGWWGGAVRLDVDFLDSKETRVRRDEALPTNDPRLIECTIVGNQAPEGGGVACVASSDAELIECTFWGNRADDGSAISANGGSEPTVINSILAGGRGGGALFCDDPNYNWVTLNCCNLYGNEGGDWVSCATDQYGIDGNFSADPLFCGADWGDFDLMSDSPCLPGNHPDGYDCGLVGAWPEGCAASGIEESSRADRSARRMVVAPNPFNRWTRFTYEIPTRSESCRFDLQVFDSAGRLVRGLAGAKGCAGQSDVIWDGRNELGDEVVGGIYYYRLCLDGQIETGPLVLVR